LQPAIQLSLGVMKSLSLSADDASLLLTWECDGSGDYLVSVEAAADGFRGHADGHVVGSDFRTFADELKRLEQNRKGIARLASAASGIFELLIESINSLGHMGASGVLQYRRPGVEYWPQQRFEFAFEFDPSQLIHAVRAVHNA
jgi:hypothetical protein